MSTDRPRPAPGAFVVWALVVLAVVYLTVLGGGAFTGLYTVELRIISVAEAVIATVAWLAVALRNPFWRPRTSLGPAIVAVLVAMAISLAGSEHPSIGIDYLAYAVLLGSAYLILQRLFAHPYFAGRLGSLAVLLGFSLSTAYIAVVVLRWIDIWSALGRFVTPPLRPDYEGLLYGNPSALAAAVIPLWLASAAHLGFSTRRRTAIVVALGGLTAIAVVLSGSRGAWAGLAIAGAVVIPAWLLDGDHRRAVAAAVRLRRVRLAAGVSLAAAAAAAILLLPALMSRLGEPASDLRSSLVAVAWRMFLEDPATGVGPGMYVVDRARLTQPAEVDYYVAHAHNIFAQTLAEFGLVGVVAAIVIAATVGRLVYRGIRSDDPLVRRLGWASLAGLAYLAAHQLFDFYANMPAIGLALALSVARLDAQVMGPSQNHTTAAPVARGRWMAPPWVPITPILIATAIALVPLARLESVALTAREATNAANAGDWPTALARARSTVDAEPDMPPYLFTLGLAAANAGRIEEARDALRRSAEIDDYPTSWLNVARLEATLGDAQSARDALARAMRLGDRQPQVAVGAASIYAELGDRRDAASAVADALVNAPGLAGDPFWTSNPELQAAWGTGLALALERLPGEQAYELGLEAGQPDVARRIVQALPEPARSTSATVVEAWTGDAAAFERLRARTTASPFDGHLVALCHRVASRATDELELDATTWTCGRAGYAYSPIVVRVGDPPTSREWLPGPNATWHFQGAYERFVPFDELVPGLPHLRAS